MYRFIVFIFWLFPTICFGQFLPEIKHVEIISEVRDSMILLNKSDVDKINKTYFEKKSLDSLNNCNKKIILLLEDEIIAQDSIIVNQNKLLFNELEINQQLKQSLENKVFQYEQIIAEESKKKTSWQLIAGASLGVIILDLLLN